MLSTDDIMKFESKKRYLVHVGLSSDHSDYKGKSLAGHPLLKYVTGYNLDHKFERGNVDEE
jgi:hypothetical protein